MKFSFRKVLSVLICLVLLLSFLMLPVSARQEESVPEESSEAVSESTEESSAETEESSGAPETSCPEETVEFSETTAESAETAGPAELPETTAAQTEEPPAEEGPKLDWNLYFGQLHAHTNISDGYGTVTEAYSYAAQVENLDFFAVTDHSDSFDGADSAVISQDGSTVSEAWAAGKAAAAAVTSENFVGIFGYEMSWQEDRQLGHISTFGTPGFASRNQEPFVHSLEHYYQALTTAPHSVSQFNHPGHQYGDFESFGHLRAEYDARICLLEVGGEGNFTAYGAYTRALDAGWHVAPTTSQNNHDGLWGSAREDRTVVLAKELTEDALYRAMESRRVYATADGDLTVYYELNGHIMGSVLGDVDRPTVSVWLSDPTDAEIGQVDVIVDGGRVAATAWVDCAEKQLTLQPEGGWSYYYLRITQPDGDIAVTAPVWTDSFEDMGVAVFASDTGTPVQGQEMNLTVELYNDENTDCHLEKLEISAGDRVVYREDLAQTLASRGYAAYQIPYTHPGPGNVDFSLEVTASAAGRDRSWRENLTLQFLPKELVAGILVDASHGSDESLKNFTALASKANMDVTFFEEEMPEGGEILLINAPSEPFEEDFLARVTAFAENGGTIIVCGQGDSRDGPVHGSAQLNRVLEAVGATMRLEDNTAADERGEPPEALYAACCNEDAPWCADLTSAQVYAHLNGGTVDPGRGSWLVRAPDTARNKDRDGDGGSGTNRVLLAWESTPWGGRVFAAGAPFLSDGAMPLPDSRWAAPRVNQSLLEQLLELEEAKLPLSTIADLRRGEPGKVYRVRGYVTAGTANPHNRFPETIYLQDDTGGVAVMPFREEGLQVGTPMEVTGYLDMQTDMPVLQWVDYDLPEAGFYRYVPKTVRCKTAMNYEENGGQLMQVEGKASAVVLTEDQKGVTRLTVTDYLGDKAEILVEPCIRAGASGKNTLASEIREGRKVRVMGLVHLDEAGKTVLRVRNCEEVVYVPPRRYPSDNPKTGDAIPGAVLVLAMTTGLLLLKKRK